MPPGNSGTFEVNGRSFILGIVELPNIFQQKASLLSQYLLRPNGILQFLSRRPLLMDKPYWQEDQLRNWRISEPTFQVEDDTSLEPYSLIQQRLFDDIVNDKVTVVVNHEDVQLPSPYEIYFLPTPVETPPIRPTETKHSKKFQKTPIFTLNSARSSASIASPMATLFCATPTLVNWSAANSKLSASPKIESVEEPTLPTIETTQGQEETLQVSNRSTAVHNSM
ncbi:hypothetical protein K493DRAFT_36156 [Basidiobolus meristosporus CBS 931.73]|uniref:Uncharacterized protein n=1 Tax=Basidiobolus meristosporus CBS 931.73 TaxID=1314790 RepID=A0A1Y1Y645_9FUNG|nr:hypothetical protein K493DRAFT_36156 [Basidiobolus meristosporus CBS 931.73]|eukprot:ORX93501.1 hypothetical protein K493DRAFT_36156 [Basidiobolus meristosporus CBS 931.73]